MTRLAWLLRWLPQDRTVLLSSHLTPDQAAAALSLRMAASQDDAWPPWILDRTAERIVRGVISPQRIRLAAGLPDIQNSFRPILQGRLLAAPGGCQLTGVLGLFWYTRALLVAILSVLGLAAFFLLGHLALDSPDMHSLGALWASLVPLVGVVSAGCVMVGGISLATRLGRNDGDYLMSWVARALQGDSEASDQPGKGDHAPE